MIFGVRPRLEVWETNSATKLLRKLRELGRDRVQICGMISEHGALSVSSIRALNAYLTHHGARGTHRFAWYDLQRDVALKWVS